MLLVELIETYCSGGEGSPPPAIYFQFSSNSAFACILLKRVTYLLPYQVGGVLASDVIMEIPLIQQFYLVLVFDIML